MKVDWDLVRALLLHTAPGIYGPPPGYPNDATLLRHKEILERLDLAIVEWLPGNDDPHFEGVVQRLTYKGEDYRELFSDEDIWQKVKASLGENLSSATLEEVVGVARSLRT